MNPETLHHSQPGGSPNEQDQAIDRLLRGLAKPEAAVGLEARVLRALAARQADLALRPSRTRRLAWPVSLATGAALLVTGAALLASVLLLRHHAPVEQAYHVTPPAVPAPVLPEAPIVQHAALLTQATPVQSTRKSAPGLTPSARTNPQAASLVPLVATLASVSIEATPANIPAPPLPLTEQERLLLRYIHRRDPEELAALGPVANSLHEQAERAAFEQFFFQPPPPPQPPQPPPPDVPTGDPE